MKLTSLGFVVFGSLLLGTACKQSVVTTKTGPGQDASFDPEADAGSTAGSFDAGFTVSADGGPVSAGCSPCTDFPKDPVTDPTGGPVPGDAATKFGPPVAAASGDICIVEPQAGVLLPKNGLRPRVTFTAPPGLDLYEIRFTAKSQTDPLVVYTRATSWTLTKTIWDALSSHSVDEPITVSVRGINSGLAPVVVDAGAFTPPPTGTPVSKAASAPVDFTIAPAAARGAIVYWTTSTGTALKGFRVGDESVIDVLRPTAAGAQCIGCHNSTPDGEYLAFAASDLVGDGRPSRVSMASSSGKMGAPPYLSPAATTLLARTPQQVPQFSPAHWTTGDRLALTLFPVDMKMEIIWTDLEAKAMDQGTGWGIVARTGDVNQASDMAFSHDGKTIVYGSSPEVVSSIDQPMTGDIYTVPFGDRKGGAAHAVEGAKDPAFNEYYPALSPDDTLVAYTRAPTGTESQSNHEAEVLVTPLAGGAATRLAANDPPACTGIKSPGITNSWAKWGSEVTTVGGKTYYWVIFSSSRIDADTPQLYLSGVVKEGDKLTSYPAFYLWNQPAEEGNHTPAWDAFKIPTID